MRPALLVIVAVVAGAQSPGQSIDELTAQIGRSPIRSGVPCSRWC